jgi:hypothetical protein
MELTYLVSDLLPRRSATFTPSKKAKRLPIAEYYLYATKAKNI